MRPHGDDEDHNRSVGQAFRHVVEDAFRMGCNGLQVDIAVGRQVNLVAQASYDLGAREAVQPHMN